MIESTKEFDQTFFNFDGISLDSILKNPENYTTEDLTTFINQVFQKTTVLLRQLFQNIITNLQQEKELNQEARDLFLICCNTLDALFSHARISPTFPLAEEDRRRLHSLGSACFDAINTDLLQQAHASLCEEAEEVGIDITSPTKNLAPTRYLAVPTLFSLALQLTPRGPTEGYQVWLMDRCEILKHEISHKMSP
jgi:hypothetical protein